MGNCSRHSRRKSQLCRTTCASSANNMTKATAIVGVTCFLLLSATVFVALSDKDHSTTDIGSPSATTDLHVDKVKDAELAVATSATSATNQDPQATSATDVYSAIYTSGDCTGAVAQSAKYTLNQCAVSEVNAGGSPTEYRKITFDGTTYSTGFYSDSTCSTTLSTYSANPYTGEAGACTAYTADGVSKSAKILSGSDYASNSQANFDCTSPTNAPECVEITNDPTTAPTSAPTNDGVIVTIFSNGDCSSTPLICYLVTLDNCYQTVNPAGSDGTVFSEGGGSKLTLSGSSYSYGIYVSNGCETLATPPSNGEPQSLCADPNPITGAADACNAFTLYPGWKVASVPYSLKVMSSSDYVTATNTYDCTSGSCVAPASNSAAHVSIGILSACLAVMAQWIA